MTAYRNILNLSCKCGKEAQVQNNYQVGQSTARLRYRVKCACGKATGWYAGDQVYAMQAWREKMK